MKSSDANAATSLDAALPASDNSIMPRIHQLPPSVITKIAAGEVIERPASVVKELLENSVDAGSTRIEVDVEQGGVEQIRVVDDGCGIDAADLPLAFASHATSKLQSADDLFRIGSLGFRGEALASIGGVAQVTLQSRPHDQPTGAELFCNGGELSEVRPWNGSPGTRIEVRHLFYNTPVRRKFLRTTATELSHVSEQVTRIALAQSKLHLALRHNGRNVFEVPATASLFDRIVLFFGKELREQLYEIAVDAGPLRVTGYIADPVCERGNARMQYLFLNGRSIRDRSMFHAIQEGYRGLVMVGRYAVAFLFLQMPPDLVDVNVHPTKSEVRFRDSSAVYHLILTAIRERLRRQNLVPELRVGSGQRAVGSEVGSQQPAPSSAAPWTLQAPAPGAGPGLPFHAPAPVSYPPIADGDRSEERTEESDTPAPPVVDAAAVVSPPATDHWPLTPSKVMQLHDAYLVLETPEGMLVIDQHALHERILFEQLKRRLQTGPLEKQRLLIPEPIDLPAEQSALALEHQDALGQLGLEITDFGGGTILLQSYPALLGRKSPGEIFQAAMEYLLTKDRPPSREVLLNHMLATMACKAAVKAGDHLSPEEITALIAQRELVNDTHHCPHGRPTTLLFSRQELDRQFGRI
jgi:DNA mismatch repair protein MutL